MKTERKLVTPGCCGPADEYGLVHLTIATDRLGEPIEPERAAWAIDSSYEAFTAWRRATQKPLEQYKPVPTHCPFCGAALPEVRPKKRPPKVHRSADGYYCDTCGERNQACECPYTTQAYEIVRPASRPAGE